MTRRLSPAVSRRRFLQVSGAGAAALALAACATPAPAAAPGDDAAIDSCGNVILHVRQA